MPTGCPAGARCETVTYYQPNVQIPSPNVYTNQPDRYRDFNGFELTFQKRTSNNWSMNASYAYNNAIDHWDSANAYEDPTNIDKLDGYQYAPESAGSGIGGIFTNAKWLFKLNGRYTMKWDINLAANYQARQGYPYLQTILSPTAPTARARCRRSSIRSATFAWTTSRRSTSASTRRSASAPSRWCRRSTSST